MKHYIFLSLCAFSISFSLAQKTTKVKEFQLKYTLPESWNAQAFGVSESWEEAGNHICHCSGILYTKSGKDGKMNVLIYPSTASGLDSAKRSFAGTLRFEDVQKYEKIKNKYFSFEKKRSNFTDTKTNKKSFDVIRYFTKVDAHFYIVYAWQENLGLLSPGSEKELFEMINAIEPMN